MININKPLILFLRSFALVSVVTLGLFSILASIGGSGSSSGDDPAPSFADAGPDQSLYILSASRLDGSGSNTPMGATPGGDDPLYFWTVLSTPTAPDGFVGPFEGAPYFLYNPDSINPTLVPAIEGEYVVQLRVRFRGLSAWDTVSVFASESPPPIARAGFDQFVKHGTLVTLDASGSQTEVEDRDVFNRLPFEYSWFINEQPAGASSTLSASDVVNPRFIAEYDADDVGGRNPNYSLYEIRLHVINDDDLVSRPVHVKTYVFPSEGYVYPKPVAGSRQKVISGSTVQLDASASFDVDDRALSYDWSFYARPPGSNASLTGADTATPTFVADQDGVYVVQLQVDNGELTSIRLDPIDRLSYLDWKGLDYAGSDRVVITAQDDFFIPVANAGPDRILPFTGPAAIPLDGSGSYSPGGGDITYQWYLITAPAGSNATIDTSNDTQPDSASLLADVAGSYVVGLSLNAPSVDFNNDHVVITLSENNPPTADAGGDQAVSVGDTVILNGISSNDPDGDPMGYSWSLASAPGPWGYEEVSPGVANWFDWPGLSDGMIIAPTFTPDRNGEYRLLLTVNDSQQSSVADEVVIMASGSALNTAPIANAGADQSVTVGDTVMLDASASSDAENDILTYSWTIEIRPLTSSAVIDNPTSETPSFIADVEGSYTVQLVVNDGLLGSSPDSMSVTAVAASGSCLQPLNLVTTLPFAPNLGEMATNIQIDAAGADTLSAITATAPVDTVVYQARIPDGTNLDQAEFVILLPAIWEEISRTHANPVSDTDSPSFVVRRISDDMYYKLDIDFTGTDMLEVQIDGLSGCRCGNSAVSCPL
jgi:hypothetical protein